MKKAAWFFYILLGFIIAFLSLLLIRAELLPGRQHPVAEQLPVIYDSLASERLKQAVSIRTVTPYNPEERDTSAFSEFRSFLEANFPFVHKHLQQEVLEKYTLLYTWKGQDTTLSPAVLMAHLDVVPADDSANWIHPPFAGTESEGYIYGRGTLDVKGSLMAILEASEHLISQGFHPRQTVCFLFGHDEESGIGAGAQSAAALLKERYGEIDFVLDEGGLILQDALPGLEQPVALVGIAEKGYMNVSLSAEGEGGHSSMPPQATSITNLASAVEKIGKSKFPARISGATASLFQFTAPEMQFPFRQLFANYDLLSPLIIAVMDNTPSGNASVRTTTAITILEAGSKENVIPEQAEAVINVRLMPGTSFEQVLAYLREIIDDSTVTVKQTGDSSPASIISDTASAAFRRLSTSARSVFPGTVVAPYLLTGVTDSRHFQHIARNIYRFIPVSLEKSDLKRIHGTNERISKDAYLKMISFYTTLLRELQ